jgi:hypothetical protein
MLSCICPRARLGVTVFEQARILTKAAALILTVAGTAECLLWRFSSHPEHSSLLLARNLITGYDLPSQEQAASAKCALFSGRFFGLCPLNVVEMGEALQETCCSLMSWPA